MPEKDLGFQISGSRNGRQFLFIVLALCLVAAPVIGLNLDQQVQVATPVPTPQFITCPSSCQCMIQSDADQKWGVGNYTSCDTRPCGEVTMAGGELKIMKYCYQQKSLPVIVTTTIPVPAKNVLGKAPAIAVQHAGIPAQSIHNIPGIERVPGSPGFLSIISLGNKSLSQYIFNPMAIRAGGKTYTPQLSPLNPYYAMQITPKSGTPAASQAKYLTIIPTTILEVDQKNSQDLDKYLADLCENPNTVMACSQLTEPDWIDRSSITLPANTELFYTNYRWIADPEDPVKPVRAFWQISEEPFSADPMQWQNQYVTGLIGSGPVNEISVDSAGYHYFRIDLMKAVNHYAGDPPYYEGFVSLNPAQGDTAAPAEVLRIPLINSGLIMKKTQIGPISLSLPTSITAIPSGQFIESELGNPNENMKLLAVSSRRHSALEDFALSRDYQIFYLRVVPLSVDGKAGVPTLPVTLYVTRAAPCSTQCPTLEEAHRYVRPPSVTITQYFNDNWESSEVPEMTCDGCPEIPAYLMSISQPDPSNSDAYNDFQTYAKGQVDYHFVLHPVEKTWYQKAWNAVKSFVNELIWFWDSVVVAWEDIQNAAIQSGELIVTNTLFLGQYDCSQAKWCVEWNEQSHNAVLEYYGIPRHLPNYQELQHAGAKYVIVLFEREYLGESFVEAQEKAQEIYNDLPQPIKDKIDQQPGSDLADKLNNYLATKAVEYSNGVVDAMDRKMQDEMSIRLGGGWYMPDPMIYAVHPGYLFVTISNPNDEPSDPVFLSVHDKFGFFDFGSDKIIPALDPHSEIVVPVVLDRAYTKFSSHPEACVDDKGRDLGKPDCYMNNWQAAIINTGIYWNNTPDTFIATLYEGKNRQYAQEVKVQESNEITLIAPPDCPSLSCNSRLSVELAPNWQYSITGLDRNIWSEMNRVSDANYGVGEQPYTYSNGPEGTMG